MTDGQFIEVFLLLIFNSIVTVGLVASILDSSDKLKSVIYFNDDSVKKYYYRLIKSVVVYPSVVVFATTLSIYCFVSFKANILTFILFFILSNVGNMILLYEFYKFSKNKLIFYVEEPSDINILFVPFSSLKPEVRFAYKDNMKDLFSMGYIKSTNNIRALKHPIEYSEEIANILIDNLSAMNSLIRTDYFMSSVDQKTYDKLCKLYLSIVYVIRNSNNDLKSDSVVAMANSWKADNLYVKICSINRVIDATENVVAEESYQLYSKVISELDDTIVATFESLPKEVLDMPMEKLILDLKK